MKQGKLSSLGQKTGTIALALVMAFSLSLPSLSFPSLSFAAEGLETVADAGTETSADKPPIEQLLAAGDYVEGEAIAVVKASAAQSEQSKALAHVSSQAVKKAARDAAATNYVATNEVADRVSAADEGGFRVEVVRDPARTTE